MMKAVVLLLTVAVAFQAQAAPPPPSYINVHFTSLYNPHAPRVPTLTNTGLGYLSQQLNASVQARTAVQTITVAARAECDPIYKRYAERILTERITVVNATTDKCTDCISRKCKRRGEDVCTTPAQKALLGAKNFFENSLPGFVTGTAPDFVTKDIPKFFTGPVPNFLKNTVGGFLGLDAGKLFDLDLGSLISSANPLGGFGIIPDFDIKIPPFVNAVAGAFGSIPKVDFSGLLKGIGGKVGDFFTGTIPGLAIDFKDFLGGLIPGRRKRMATASPKVEYTSPPSCSQLTDTEGAACLFYATQCPNCQKRDELVEKLFDPPPTADAPVCAAYTEAEKQVEQLQAEYGWINAIPKGKFNDYEVISAHFNPAPSAIDQMGNYRGVLITVRLFGKTLSFTSEEPIQPFIAYTTGPKVSKQALDEFKKWAATQKQQ